MFFYKIELVRFGPHEHLLLDELGYSVILTGPSGRGKTHIMAALEFLLNGKIEKAGAIETFVHDYGVEGADPTASVEGWFHTHGGSGRIKRTFGIGKRTTRELEWGGELFKSDADVSTKLDELFDVGKRSLASTVFLRQGEIRSGLFTTPTAREDLMLRMLSLEWTAKVAEASAKKKSAVLGNMPDLAPARDQAAFAYNQAHTDYETASRVLRESTDFTPDLTSLRNLQHARRTLDATSATVQGCVEDENRLRQSLTALLAEAGGAVSVEEFGAQVDAEREKLSALQNRLVNLQQSAQMIQTRNTLQQNVTTLTAELAALRAERPGIAALASQAKLDDLRALAAKVSAAELLRTRIANGEKISSDAQAALTRLGARPVVADHTKEIAGLEQRIEDLRPLVELLRGFKHAGGDVTCGACPTCKSALDSANFDLVACQAAVDTSAKCRQDIANLRAEMESTNRAASDYDREVAVTQQQIAGYVTQLDTLRKELETLGAPTSVPADLDVQISRQAQMVGRLAHIDANVTAKEPELARCSAQLAGLPQDLPATVDVEPARVEHAAAQASVANLMQRLQTLQQAERAASEKAAVVASHRKELEKRTIELTQADAAVTHQARATLTILEGSIEMATSDLEQKQAAWLSAEAAQKTAARLRTDAATRLNNIDADIQKQAKKRIVADKLERLTKAFSRNGVPSAIVQDRWGMLVGLTQAYLRQSEAPFSVRVSTDLPVSVDFLLHKRPTSGYRPMSKMSGGEGMVFAVRFAFAVQQLLTPKLGLLSLDEPSTHLDAEGTQQLGAVLSRLITRLKNSSSQIWVTDHNPLLAPFFSTAVELPPLKQEGLEESAEVALQA